MEDFVTFELAVKLKEKGFREGCLRYYDATDMEYCNESPLYCNKMLVSYNSFNDTWHIDFIDAPTISQVLKWLRKEKKIHVFARYCWLDSRWWWEMSKLDVHNFDYSDSEYLTHDDAILAGIECVLDNWI